MRYLLAVVFALVTTSAGAQSIFEMNYGADVVAAGWPGGAVPESATHSVTRVPGGGPQGQDAYDMVQRPALDAPMFGGEYYWGWNGTLPDPVPDRVFLHWRMRFTPDTNFRGVEWRKGAPLTLTNKIVIIGDGCRDIGPHCRVIVSYRGNGGRAADFRVAIDGGDSPANVPDVAVGRWLDIQIELIASTDGQANGGYKIWINNDNYKRPSAEFSNIVLNKYRWEYVSFGAHNNNGLEAKGVHAFRHADFGLSASFMERWHAGAAAPRSK